MNREAGMSVSKRDKAWRGKDSVDQWYLCLDRINRAV